MTGRDLEVVLVYREDAHAAKTAGRNPVRQMTCSFPFTEDGAEY